MLINVRRVAMSAFFMGPETFNEVTAVTSVTPAVVNAEAKLISEVKVTVTVVGVSANIAFATNTIMKEVNNAFTFFIFATTKIIVSVERFNISGAKVAKIRAQKNAVKSKSGFLTALLIIIS